MARLKNYQNAIPDLRFPQTLPRSIETREDFRARDAVILASASVFLLSPSVMSAGSPRLVAGCALRHWLKHPRNLTSKCVTGCQCLYTWRRLVERIRITVRRVIH